MRRVVIDLGSSRPVWRAPPGSLEAIRRALGDGWDVVEVRSPASSDGDGASGSAEAVKVAQGAEVYLGWGVPSGVARAAQGSLRWAHSASAGVLASLSPEFLATGAVLTNSRGVQAEPMADWVVAAIGFCLRGFHAAVRAQRDHVWAKDAFTDGRVVVKEYNGARVGLVGLGGIGRAVARRCHALGMAVRAVRRRRGGRRPAGVLWVGGPDAIEELAAESDVLIVTAPHTPETEGLVGASVLESLPEGAFLINVSRGVLVDEEALLRQITDGRLAGCVLDVFAQEPLPVGHPFWDHPAVMITPHVSAVSTRFWDRETTLIIENIARYRVGQRLKNVVEPEIGY